MTPVVIGNATWIYSLCEFPSMVPRYVGKTTQPLRARMRAHQLMAMRNPRLPVHRWLAKRKRDGRQVCINRLDRMAPGSDWIASEKHWIAKLRNEGARLLNLTNGGEGLAGHKFSENHKAKIAAALRRGATFNCKRCGSEFWRKPYAIKTGQTKFCSRLCANEHNKGGTNGAA